MKSFRNFLLEQRLIHKEYGDWNGHRIQVDSHLRDSEQNWLTKALNKTIAVETTVDLDRKNNTARLNYSFSHFRGKGYAPETMNYIFGRLKEHGYKKITGYIEHNNFASQTMAKKLGLKKLQDAEHGAYYEKEL